MMTAIGATRHAVTLEDPRGPLDPVLWYCAVQTAGASVGDGIQGYRVRGRYHPGITLETRIRMGTPILQVQTRTDVDERHVELELFCAEVVGRHGGE